MLKFVEVIIGASTYPESDYEECTRNVILCGEDEVKEEVEIIEVELKERSSDYGTTFHRYGYKSIGFNYW